ncbi:hypothetical protein DCAR_0208669 [Daucus carota subsp. sativus]|uniref:Knottin scorpion toxin-like domain-containing protein n=1 Tax=Daucus carota subsp. sativus TaxID=79200 RepID=A0AAF1AR89_DAUCS|nr:PREDICTED: thionin-like [Daucus carota subsp. sativus]WOG89431.1 hypothetical protein DCAR_0208669 [Daucus carota subsp. sativus]
MEMTNTKLDVNKILLGIVLLVLATSGARAATEYECWGGCYNKCIILKGDRIPTTTTYPCYYKCLSSCRPSSPQPSLNYYCQLGCAADLCNTLTILDNGNLKQCIGRCSKVCQP